MKKTLFLILSLAIFLQSFTQGPQKIITINSDHQQTPFPALIYLPIGYATSTQNYPLIVFLHGSGEASGTAVNDSGYLAGKYLVNLYNNQSSDGPAYSIANGTWPDSFANPNTGVYSHFIVVSPQAPGWSTAGSQLNYIISNFIAMGYRVDVNRIYVTGLSAGGQGVMDYVNHNAIIPMYEAAAVVPMSAACAASLPGADSAVIHGISAWGFGSDPSDNYGVSTHLQMTYMQGIVGGNARFTNYTGGHCCWGQFYTPTYKEVINGKSMNIYQWMLLSGRSGGVTISNPPPVIVPPVSHRKIITPHADGGNWIPPGTYNPGDTVIVSSKYRWTYLSGDGLHGTPGHPIVIMNDTGQVTLLAGIAFTNSTYVHVTGTGSPNYFYGFYITSADTTPPLSRGNSLQFSARSAFCEVDHIDEYKKTYAMWLKQEVDCADSLNYPNWRLDNFSIHDIRARNITQDGFYLGSTSPNGERSITCNGVTSSPIPMRMSNITVYNIIIDSVARTGIQLSGADSGMNEIYNCQVGRTGFEINPQQGSGIILGGYTEGYVHNNRIRQTYQHGIFAIGAGLQMIENNDIDSSGWLNGVINPGYSNICADTRLTTNQGMTPGGILSDVSIQNNKCGLASNRDTVAHLTYQIDIGLGYTQYPTWDTSNIICNNITQAAGLAIFRVNPNIKFVGCGIVVPPPPPPGKTIKAVITFYTDGTYTWQ